MIQGLYSGAAAMDVLAKQQDMISTNLTHLNTGGHRKSQFAVIERLTASESGPVHNLGPVIQSQKVDFTQGRHQQTDRALDVALSGDGFFVLEGPDGNLYTRNGRFYRHPESGQLINDGGLLVQGTNGPIAIDENVSDREISFGNDGSISANGQEIGKLSIVAFEDNSTLNPISDTVFGEGPNSTVVESQASVNQFHQEFSNANAVSELISLIIGSRQYEAVQKASKTISESLREHIRA